MVGGLGIAKETIGLLIFCKSFRFERGQKSTFGSSLTVAIFLMHRQNQSILYRIATDFSVVRKRLSISSLGNVYGEG